MSELSPIRVGILVESVEAEPITRHARETLESFGVPYAERTITDRALAREAIAAMNAAVYIVADTSPDPLSAAVAGLTTKPVLAVPVETPNLSPLDALRASTRGGGAPVGALAVGKPGAINAALLAVAIFANVDASLRQKLEQFRADQTAKVLADALE